MMSIKVKKHIDSHVCICRKCSGTGHLGAEETPCPHCEGSGRLVVESDIITYVTPYRHGGRDGEVVQA